MAAGIDSFCEIEIETGKAVFAAKLDYRNNVKSILVCSRDARAAIVIIKTTGRIRERAFACERTYASYIRDVPYFNFIVRRFISRSLVTMFQYGS